MNPWVTVGGLEAQTKLTEENGTEKWNNISCNSRTIKTKLKLNSEHRS